MRRRWPRVPVGMLVALTLVMPAFANNEMEPGARLFYPLWDVSNPARLTFIVVTREALNEGAGQVSDSPGNCLPRGAGGSTTEINRTDLGGTADEPVFVDDVHFQWYGRGCGGASEIVRMSCADIDLYILAHPSNPNVKPRFAFQSVAAEGRGALDVHLITNSLGAPGQRKLENSLMGHAIIADLGEGWVATYPAASAKATACPFCAQVSGSAVGYENYPMEVFLPLALAEGGPAPGGSLRNILSLWGPGLFAGANLIDTSLSIEFKWWDGRERAFSGAVNGHSIIRPLGGPTIAGLDTPLDPSSFNVANFVCGHDAAGEKAENDGFPRSGTSASACGAPAIPDTAHPSDNFEVAGDTNIQGHRIQGSTPISWWRFRLQQGGRLGIPGAAHSGRGLVGVVLSSTPGATIIGVGDAVRLWHKGSCQLAQSNQSYGPPHLRDGGLWANQLSAFTPGDFVSLFNVFDLDDQGRICAGLFTVP